MWPPASESRNATRNEAIPRTGHSEKRHRVMDPPNGSTIDRRRAHMTTSHAATQATVPATLSVMSDPDNIRLFVAIELPDDVRDALATTIDHLRAIDSAQILRFVRPAGIHITLKFFGATAADRVPAIEGALAAVRLHAAFDLATDAVGSFGGARNLRVVWLGVDDDTNALAAIASLVEDALLPLGFARETRPFAAHLTLARVRDDAPPDDRALMHAALRQIAQPPPVAFHIDQISLMQSTLGRGGATYTQLATCSLSAGDDG